MSRERLKFKDPGDWRRVYERFGAETAGRPPAGAALPPSPATEGWKRQLPVAPMIFGGPGPERLEHYEERQRWRRVDAILKKHDIGQRPGALGWRM